MDEKQDGVLLEGVYPKPVTYEGGVDLDDEEYNFTDPVKKLISDNTKLMIDRTPLEFKWKDIFENIAFTQLEVNRIYHLPYLLEPISRVYGEFFGTSSIVGDGAQILGRDSRMQHAFSEAVVDFLESLGIAQKVQVPVQRYFSIMRPKNPKRCVIIKAVSQDVIEYPVYENQLLWNDCYVSDAAKVLVEDYYLTRPDDPKKYEDRYHIDDLTMGQMVFSYYRRRTIGHETKPDEFESDNGLWRTKFPKMTRAGLYLETVHALDIEAEMPPRWFPEYFDTAVEKLIELEAFSLEDGKLSIGRMFFKHLSYYNRRLWESGIGHGWKMIPDDLIDDNND